MIFWFKFTVINQCSLSLRGFNFWIALENRFWDNLLSQNINLVGLGKYITFPLGMGPIFSPLGKMALSGVKMCKISECPSQNLTAMKSFGLLLHVGTSFGIVRDHVTVLFNFFLQSLFPFLDLPLFLKVWYRRFSKNWNWRS